MTRKSNWFLSILLVSVGAQATPQTAPSDAFTKLLARQRRDMRLPFMVSDWTRKIIDGQIRPASHLWSAVKTQLPASFQATGTAAELYTLWKLGLPNTFFNEWATAIANPQFAQSKANAALTDALEEEWTTWLETNTFAITDKQRTLWINHQSHPTLKARFALRGDQTQALAIAAQLPETSLLRWKLAEGAATDLAKQGKVEAAIALAEKYGEAAQDDAQTASAYHVLMARLRYQDGDLERAIAQYDQVAGDYAQYPLIIEERGWALARSGDYDRLRGDLFTLRTPVLKNFFGPESYVLQSVSELKLCRYDGVRKTFAEFDAAYSPVAKQITSALREKNSPVAPWSDDYSKLALQTQAQVQNEIHTLAELERESLSAPLSAVGRQSHWKAFANELGTNLQAANDAVAKEQRRIWMSHASMLSEAIKKMRFVKLELLMELGISPSGTTDTQKTSTLADLHPAPEADGVQTFPYEGVVWPDELFHFKAMASNRCPGAENATAGAR
ncbi:MAG: tetratricopeptide repeat protein [Bdellovibrionales bacterium]|nr:tetratricopeptide repeat protein [Bdellovibrionales bacterium]